MVSKKDLGVLGIGCLALVFIVLILAGAITFIFVSINPSAARGIAAFIEILVGGVGIAIMHDNDLFD